MGFDVSSLTDYTEKATQILTEAVIYAEDYANYDVMVGVKHKEYLNYLDTNPTVQAGGCSVPVSGSTTFEEKEVQVVKLSVLDNWCLSDLDAKDLQAEIGTAKGVMEGGLKAVLVKDEVAKIKKEIDRLFWVGKTASGDLLNGIVTEAIADADVIDVASHAIDVTNIDDYITKMILAVTDEMWARGVQTIHVSSTYYNLYRQNRINANMFHDNPSRGALSMDVFGWEGQVILKSEPGLNGTKNFLLTADKNIVFATDQLHEVASAKLYFDEITKLVYFISDWKMGATYKYGEEIVLFIAS